MTCYLLHSYLPAFCSTVSIELGVAILLGYWSPRALLAVLLVNVVTHPALHVFILVVYYIQLMPLELPLVLTLEVAVFLIEWWLLAYSLRLRPARAACLSFSMNAASYLLGLLLVG